MDNNQFRYEAFKNNTFNLKAVERSLEESKMSSYEYLKQFQLDSTGYKRFDFNMQDIYRTNKVNHNWSYVPRRWLFFIEHDFIDSGKRIKYKRSSLYEKDLSYNDIINHPDLFTHSFLVFIDGKLYTEDIKVLCKEDKTYMIFICKEKPSDIGIPIKDMLDMLERNVDVSIVFLPNVGLSNITTNGYRVKDTNKYQGLPYRLFNLSEHAEYNDDTLSYVKYKGASESKPATLSFGSNGVFVDKEAVQLSIDMDPRNTTFDIQLIPLRYLMQKVVIPSGEKWFKLPIKDYPIAVENCLVFDSDSNFMHRVHVNSYYPNIYSIENVEGDKELHVYVFYYENSQSVLKHQNILDVYHKYTPDYLDKYKNGTIPEFIKNFEPPVVEYDINNYNNLNYPDNHFKYKIDKMWEFIKSDVNNFRRYLVNLGLRNNYYYVDMSKIELESKKRTDNSDTGLTLQTFDEEMYMFVFRNDFRGMYDKLLLTLDGTRYETLHFFGTDKHDFVYIPCRLVNSDSILEIEKLTEVLKEYEFTATDGTVEIAIGDFAVRNKTLFNDLFLVDKETYKYIDTDSYEILHVIDGVERNIVNSDVFLPCTRKVKIKVTDKILQGRRVVLHIKKNFRFASIKVQEEPDILQPITFSADVKNDRRYIRIYRNGRLVPRHLGTSKFPPEFSKGVMEVYPGVLRDINDNIAVELMPYMMNQVCYLETIPNDKVIDLSGKIDKPLDFRWHDIYVNGRKLSKKEVEIISANKFKLLKTNSLRWLEVIENSRDKEYFGYTPVLDFIDHIYETDEEFKKVVDDSIDKDNMQDIEDPVVDVPVSIEDYILRKFYDNYLVPNYGLLNPDLLQLDQATVDYYYEIMDGEPFLFNPDYGRIGAELYLPINPDTTE